MTIHLNKLIKITLLIIGLIPSILAYGQSESRIINGTVTDAEEGDPLIGVTILLKSKPSIGTVTDIDGNYSMKVPDNQNETLTFSYIGYSKKEANIGSSTRIDVTLELDLQALEEVVVVGYGSVKKSDLTGSVASVKAEEFNPGPVVSVSSHLQNTAPGVVMTQTSAQPGGNFSVQVRGQTSLLGSNEPLYVIDGLPISNDNVTPGSGALIRYSPSKNPLNGINPNDILSIEVLKDASAAAIYGSRGANGVVLITTKSGSEKTRVNYTSSVSIQELSNQYDFLTGSEYAKVTNEWSEFLELQPVFSPAEVKNAGIGTNWLEEVSRTHGLIQQHQLSTSGKSGHLNYYLSGNYYEHNGLIQNTDLIRYTGRINLNARLNDNVKVGTNLTLSQTDNSNVHFGDNAGGGTFNGIFSYRDSWPSNVPVYNKDGSYSKHPVVPELNPNPVSLLNITDNSRDTRILGSVFTDFELTSELSAKVRFGFDFLDSDRSGYVPTSVLSGAQVNGDGELSSNQSQNILSELTFNYSKQLGSKHRISALAGYTYQTFQSEGYNVHGQNFSSETTNINDMSGASLLLPGYSYKQKSKLISYISRLNYDFDDRYVVTATFRADGSTKFGANNKWGFFPSGALAWKIHNEAFFSSGFIEELKMRLSYGKTGNQEIGNKLSQSLYGSTRPFILGTDEQITIGLAPVRPENDNLKWETTTQYNVGFDVSVWSGRIQASLDAYRKITTDVLLNFTLDPTSGFESITANAGALQNHGVELQLKSINTFGEYKWTSGFNVAYNENRWKDRAGLPYANYEIEKGPVQGIYSYVVDGIWQTGDDISSSAQPTSKPGQFRFVDLDGDDRITGDDRKLIGQGVPDLTFGINNRISWKNLELSFFLQGVYGVTKFNHDRSSLNNVNDILFGRNKSREVLSRWTPENPSNKIPSGIVNTVGDDFRNSVYYEDASFLRMRNVTLSYAPTFEKVFSSFRVYLDVQNLLTITDWTGIDPETGNDYPNARTYTIGIDVTLK